MSFKKFNQFITEGDMSTSTNRVSQETSLKQAYPDAEDSEDQDKYNPSIINKVAIKNNDVSFIGKKKTKGKSIDTFSNRNKDEETEGQSTLSQSGVSEGDINDGELEVGIDNFLLNENAAIAAMLATTSTVLLSKTRGLDSGTGKFSLSKWFKSFIDDIKIKRIVKRLAKDPEIVDLVKKHTHIMGDGRMNYSNLKGIRKLLKDKLDPDEMKYLKIGWGPRLRKVIKLHEGGMGDNQVAGQRVYTQHTDKSKQGYQDSMYYGDEEVDDHGPECDCPDCTAKFD